MDPHSIAQQILEYARTATDINEADTRHHIIDRVLHDVLAWPRTQTKCESYVNPGFADYVLVNRLGEPSLFIEAKKTGHYFSLPTTFKNDGHSSYVKIKTLLTDQLTKEAIEQVWNYCSHNGCEYAAVTNGNQWIVFKCFVKGKDWREMHAFVIERLEYFAEEFVDATNKLSFAAIFEGASLLELFGDPNFDRRPQFFPKVEVDSYDQEVLRNHLAKTIRPMIERYFGRMNPHDDDFMQRCYISRREYRASEESVRQVIDDTLSPFFRDYNVKDLFEEKEGGQFFERIPSGKRDKKSRDVVVLFGGKGAGKSTFSSRLLFHRPPNSIRHFSKPAIVDLLECPEQKEVITSTVWSQLIAELDSENFLSAGREELLQLFDDRFTVAKRQDLAGISEQSETFNVTLNSLVQRWKDDATYVAKKLADHWKKHHRGVIVVLDNTDQFSPEIQEFCFTLAHQIATELDCLVIISMREERFHISRISGTLDAFPNSGFHLTSPLPKRVFLSRIRYVQRILKNKERVHSIAPEMDNKQVEHLSTLLHILFREFRNDDSHLSTFIRACAHGNMRLALDFFREFMLSGYTRVDEMLKKPTWTLQIHQVLRPMMVPYRLFYDETKSNVPNIFQIRSVERGSNLTGLRLLRFLSFGQASSNPSYVPMAKVRTYFRDKWNMLEDAEMNIDVFLRRGIVESDKRIDFFSDAIDSIKITAFGFYLLDVLCHNFSYLDLVCLDCGIHDQSVAHDLANCGNKDVQFFFSGKKRERIQIRLQKVLRFLDYLQSQESLEHSFFLLNPNEPLLIPQLRERYEVDAKRVLKSASRNYENDHSSSDMLGEMDHISDD